MSLVVPNVPTGSPGEPDFAGQKMEIDTDVLELIAHTSLLSPENSNAAFFDSLGLGPNALGTVHHP